MAQRGVARQTQDRASQSKTDKLGKTVQGKTTQDKASQGKTDKIDKKVQGKTEARQRKTV
jgi:hypothetical protein